MKFNNINEDTSRNTSSTSISNVSISPTDDTKFLAYLQSSLEKKHDKQLVAQVLQSFYPWKTNIILYSSMKASILQDLDDLIYAETTVRLPFRTLFIYIDTFLFTTAEELQLHIKLKLFSLLQQIKSSKISISPEKPQTNSKYQETVSETIQSNQLFFAQLFSSKQVPSIPPPSPQISTSKNSFLKDNFNFFKRKDFFSSFLQLMSEINLAAEEKVLKIWFCFDKEKVDLNWLKELNSFQVRKNFLFQYTICCADFSFHPKFEPFTLLSASAKPISSSCCVQENISEDKFLACLSEEECCLLLSTLLLSYNSKSFNKNLFSKKVYKTPRLKNTHLPKYISFTQLKPFCLQISEFIFLKEIKFNWKQSLLFLVKRRMLHKTKSGVFYCLLDPLFLEKIIQQKLKMFQLKEYIENKDLLV
eukprot:snap_masked-scaffold_26-processed-gene-2.46-mRNA-1 protein AED:1.00 eAED:1.00 QI:0/-1/0/0/-1/1/1/0/417